MGTQPNNSEAHIRETANLIAEISALCTLINFQTEYSVFLNISGHVNTITVTIAKNKTIDFIERIASSECYYGSDHDSEENMIKELTGLKLSLKKILHDRKIDYSQLDYSEYTEIIRDYKLYPAQDFKVKP